MIAALLDAIDAALAGRTPSPETRVTPWHGWLVVALLRQRDRQVFHRRVVKQLLALDVEQDDDDDGGAVPDMPGWRYHFHGIGCCLTSPEGEIIDVDQNDDEAAVIDPFFFAWRVRSLRERSGPEERLWRFMPDSDLIASALDELVAMAAIEPWKGDHLFCLAPALEARVERVAASPFDQPAVARRFREALGDVEEPALIERHRRWLVERILNRRRAYGALKAARTLLPPELLRSTCEAIIEGPIDPATGCAVEVLREVAAIPFVPAVRALLDRIAPLADPPYVAHETVAYLLERGIDVARAAARLDELSAVEKPAGFRGNPFLGDYAILALRFVPARALPIVRRALRGGAPISVQRIAGLLAAIDRPWCHRELSAALDEVDGIERHYLVAALARSESMLARRRGAARDRAPMPAPGGIGYSSDEVHHASAGGALDAEIEQQRPLAATLRDREPPPER